MVKKNNQRLNTSIGCCLRRFAHTKNINIFFYKWLTEKLLIIFSIYQLFISKIQQYAQLNVYKIRISTICLWWPNLEAGLSESFGPSDILMIYEHIYMSRSSLVTINNKLPRSNGVYQQYQYLWSYKLETYSCKLDVEKKCLKQRQTLKYIFQLTH